VLLMGCDELLRKIYSAVRGRIEERFGDFKRIWERGGEEVFCELVFCLLTPQSKARKCWAAVERLQEKGLLLEGDACQISRELQGVRFKHKKASYIVEARRKFWKDGAVRVKEIIGGFANAHEAGEWLVENIKGMGYKEASHFLRNVGWGEELAILDRHILKNLLTFGIIKEIPSSLSKRKYLEIERRMKAFAQEVGIPMGHLDLVLWYKETGEIFK